MYKFIDIFFKSVCLDLPYPLGLTVHSINEMSEQEFAEIIKPVSFYNTKAKNIKKVASILLQKQEPLSRDSIIDIPRTFNDLVALPGVGPKMAHLVMTVAWNEYVMIFF